MDKDSTYSIYQDIKSRTNGEIYMGVVGPVRTGKSTFIRRFMEQMILPNLEEQEKNQAKDEMPLSGNGKLITTVEPKFIPKEAITLKLDDELELSVRVIDCVGYMVDGASGHMEDGAERMVKTPWFDHEIPFTKAAEIGTEKVIRDHSTIGIVITSDGSYGELDRKSFLEPEEKTILELKKIGKPFVVLVNTIRPYSEEAINVAKEIEEKYQISAMPINCEQLKREEINTIMEKVLQEFPIEKIAFYYPEWVEMLGNEHKVKQNLIQNIQEFVKGISTIKDFRNKPLQFEGDYIRNIKSNKINLGTGAVNVDIDIDDKYYYENMSELIGTEITGEYQLISMMKELCQMKQEYQKVSNAMDCVRQKGYGVITPELEEIVLEEPVLMKHGNKYGVKMKADSPSIHLIRANITTEIAPIVGNEAQAKDLIAYIEQNKESEEGIWSTSIFGKSIEDLVADGIRNKISLIGEESQIKLQETMQKIVNDSSGGMVCIII